MRKLFYGASVVVAFFVTIGLLMPWLISNNTMPFPITLMGFVILGIAGLILLDKTLRALCSSLRAIWSDIHD